jgi:hypothetical protein
LEIFETSFVLKIDETCPCRIEMNIGGDGSEVAGIICVNGNGLITTLEKMAAMLVPDVPTLGKGLL